MHELDSEEVEQVGSRLREKSCKNDGAQYTEGRLVVSPVLPLSLEERTLFVLSTPLLEPKTHSAISPVQIWSTAFSQYVFTQTR